MSKKNGMAKVDRAAAGGGRVTALPAANNGSFPYQVSYNPGTGNAADWFGPGKPMTPQAPPEVAGRAFDYPAAVNIINRPRSGNIWGYESLRAFSDNYDLLRIIIEGRKKQLYRLQWVVQLKDNKQKITPQVKNKIKALTKFFKKPDGEHNFKTWMKMLSEDYYVIDAATLHRRRTRGGKLISLDQIDGSTIARVLDENGRTPEDPGDTAYQQYLKGIPAVNYTTNDLYYRPNNPRINKIYGYSPVEQIMMTVNIALRRQIFQLNYFTEGNIPAALIGVPDTWTPDQIKIFQEWFDNILAGNLAEKRKARFVPSAVGKTYIPTQETELFGAAEEWLARVTCYAFSTSPEPFIKTTNRAVPGSSQETMSVEGLDSDKLYFKDWFDEILENDLDADDFEFVWKGDDELDAAKRQLITSGYLKDGLLTVNEARVDMGREPYDDEMYDQPMVMTSNGLAPLIMPPMNYPADAAAAAAGEGDAGQTGTAPKPNTNPAGQPAPGKTSEQGKNVLAGADNKSTGGKGNTKPTSLAVNKMVEHLVTLGDEKLLTAYFTKLTDPAELAMMQGA